MKSMSNVDIFTISNELNNLLSGARVDKSFQPTRDIVVIRFHVPGTGRVDLVMQCGSRIHTSKYPLENPTNPPTFPMLLRKRVKGAHVVSVSQHNFDRVVEIKVKKDKYYTIVVELFDKGNIILLDEENNIILPLKRKHWSTRDISSKREYVFPEERGINPIEITENEFKALFENNDIIDKSVTTIYRYINKGYLTTKRVDLPYAVKYKKRNHNKKYDYSDNNKIDRTNHTYLDYLAFLHKNPRVYVWQLDSLGAIKTDIAYKKAQVESFTKLQSEWTLNAVDTNIEVVNKIEL